MLFDEGASILPDKTEFLIDFELLAKANHLEYRYVDKHEDLDDAVKEMRNAKGAFLLEVRVQKEENVFPMVPAGQPLENIRLE